MFIYIKENKLFILNSGGKLMAKLPLTPLGRIIKNGGAERVSEDAKIALSELFEDVSADITQVALQNAESEGRKTLKAEDIEVAYKYLY